MTAAAYTLLAFYAVELAVFVVSYRVCNKGDRR